MVRNLSYLSAKVEDEGLQTILLTRSTLIKAFNKRPQKFLLVILHSLINVKILFPLLKYIHGSEAGCIASSSDHRQI